MLTPTQIVRLRRAGIRMPVRMDIAARKAGLPRWLACSILVQETGGGRNEWGHDPTIFVGGYDARHGVHYGETVTKAAYLAYKRQRGDRGQGGMQGVGPCQLTYYYYQDLADAIGGCWRPLANMRIGFSCLASLVRAKGVIKGVAAYNGSGAAATRYANEVLARRAQFVKILGER